MALNLIYKVSRELGVVTVYPANLPNGVLDREAFGVDLTAADLTLMLAELRGKATLTWKATA